jgi:hypothetical protein
MRAIWTRKPQAFRSVSLRIDRLHPATIHTQNQKLHGKIWQYSEQGLLDGNREPEQQPDKLNAAEEEQRIAAEIEQEPVAKTAATKQNSIQDETLPWRNAVNEQAKGILATGWWKNQGRAAKSLAWTTEANGGRIRSSSTQIKK